MEVYLVNLSLWNTSTDHMAISIISLTIVNYELHNSGLVFAWLEPA